MSKKILLDKSLFDKLNKLDHNYQHSIHSFDDWDDDIEDIIKDYYAIFIRSGTKITKSVLDKASLLKFIHRTGVGVDSIDVEEAKKRGITVTNMPLANSDSVAEFTVGMILSLLKYITKNAFLGSPEWRHGFVGVNLKNRKVGIIGYGNIGSRVAKLVEGFGASVFLHDPIKFTLKTTMPYYAQRIGRHGCTRYVLELDELLKTCDIITIHTPLNGSTENLIGKKELKLLGPNGYIINCARAGIINEQDLADALENDVIAGAALDVIKNKDKHDASFGYGPLKELMFPTTLKLLITYHIAGNTHEAQDNIIEEILKRLDYHVGSGVECNMNIL